MGGVGAPVLMRPLSPLAHMEGRRTKLKYSAPVKAQVCFVVFSYCGSSVILIVVMLYRRVFLAAQDFFRIFLSLVLGNKRYRCYDTSSIALLRCCPSG